MSTSRSVWTTAGAAVLLATVLVPPTATAETADTAGPCGRGGVYTAAPPTCTYATAGTDAFTVPDGVTSVSVVLYGAEGGSAAGFVTPNPPNTGAPGGRGGETRATLAVSPGQTLQITLGAAGVPGTSRRGEYARPGGYGHGSGGGGAHGGGGSGGGGSDVRTGAFGPADRLLVAGGGGGAGNGGPLLRGGHGGGLSGEPGGQGGGPEGSGIAGGGGTQTAHGVGSPNSRLGGPGAAGGGTDPNTGLPNPGSGGAGGNGGRGGPGGGGGGGGYFGGAGGSGGGNPDNLPGAGGGGGSGFATPAATDVSLATGVNAGNGKAVVSFRYGTTLSLAPDTADPLFGHAVTFTAAVSPAALAPANPAAGTPSGTVQFSDDTTLLASVPLSEGRARFTTSALQPGAHTLTARYSGDPDFTPSTTAGPAEVTVGFSSPCVTSAHHGPLTVSAGQSLCIGSGGSQYGPVEVRPGGALSVSGGQITGPVTADGALALSLCGSSTTGPLAVRRSSGYVLLGSSAGGTPACPGNTLTGPLSLDGNTGGVEVSANTITGPVSVTANSGAGLPPAQDGPAFEFNKVTGPLRCSDNTPVLHQGSNTVKGPRSGQCH